MINSKITNPIGLIFLPKLPKGSILGNSNFLYLWGVQILTQVGVRLLDFVLAIQIYNTTASNASVSYLIIAYGAPALLFSAVAGVLVDKWNKKGTLLLINTLRAFLLVIFIFVTRSVSIVLLFAFLLAFFTQFFVPVEGSSIPKIVKRKHLLTANSLFTLTIYSSGVLGFIGAGPLIKTLGNDGAIAFIACMFILATIFTFSLPNIDKNHLFNFLIRKKHRSIKDLTNQLSKSLKIVKNNSYIQYALFFMGASQVIVGVFMGLMPGLAVTVLGLSAEDSSIYLMGPAAFGMVIGALYISKYSSNLKELVLLKIGILGSALSFFLISLMPNLNRLPTNFERDIEKYLKIQFVPVEVNPNLVLAALFLTFFSGFFNSFITVTCNTILQKKTNQNDRGKIYGLLQTVVAVCAALPLVLAGTYADKYGVPIVFRVLSFVIIGLFAISFYGKSAKNI